MGAITETATTPDAAARKRLEDYLILLDAVARDRPEAKHLQHATDDQLDRLETAADFSASTLTSLERLCREESKARLGQRVDKFLSGLSREELTAVSVALKKKMEAR